MALFNAIDAKPFRPFSIELMSGNRIEIEHSDNIFILPNRQTVHHIQVFGLGPTYTALIWPEGIVGLYYNGNGGGPSAS
jgi:hypothetical protein